MQKKKGFTLIELVAVLVILAILALIVTPLVLNIIRKARVSADKRSIDAYGRSVEIAVANYLLETTKFPTSIDNLKIEYKGDEVVCTKRILNEDGSVYLSDCIVGGRSVEYTYGKSDEQEPGIPTYSSYSIGDLVTYNNVNYYVIKDSAASESSVTLLKAEPLTYEEVETYSSGTSASIYNKNGYGKMAYYTSESCHFSAMLECKSDYESSDIKYVVDAWKAAKAPLARDARLISIDDLKDNLGYALDTKATSEAYIKTENTPSWLYNVENYWTMNSRDDSVWFVTFKGDISYDQVWFECGAVRPVITISKSIL